MKETPAAKYSSIADKIKTFISGYICLQLAKLPQGFAKNAKGNDPN